MALPQAVERALAEADAAQAALTGQVAGAAENVVDDPSQLQSANDDPSASQAPTPAPAPAPAPQEDWQQKYRSLQGMFAQKTGELQGQVKLYESRLAAMQQQLDALTHKDAEPAKKAAIDPKDVENFGADLVDMVQRVAAQFSGKNADLEARIVALEKMVTGVSQKADSTLEQQFYGTLEAMVPNWQQINADQKWLDWLGEIDPVYGVPRQAALDVAFKALDAKRVAVIFKKFVAENPPPKAESLANQVAPSTAAAPTKVRPAAPAKQTLSSKFVNDFYRDLTRGKYANNPEEAKRIEAEIDSAAREGRIR